MRPFLFKNVYIDSTALLLPETEVSSAELEDRLTPVYQRLGVPYGTLEKVSGIKTRRLWPAIFAPSTAATEVTRTALEKSSIPLEKIGAIISCSVTRDYFEPGVSSLVHGNIGLREDAMAFDITNACIGFSNGIQVVAGMIDAGVIEAGIVVAAESIGRIIESSINLMNADENITREHLLRNLPTLTLGCGGAAAVLCNKKLTEHSHRVVGCVARTASQHNQLCKGNGDFPILQRLDLNPVMHTESQGLIGEAAKLGGRMWTDFSEALSWSRDDVDHIFCHQVGRQVNQAFYKEMTLDMAKEFTIYERYGNLVSASLPAAFFTGLEEKPVKQGEKVLLTAFGSGLNSVFMGIEW